jgi:hypothetical protein
MSPETPAESDQTAGAIRASADPKGRRRGLHAWTVVGPFGARCNPDPARSAYAVWKVRGPAVVPFKNARRCVGPTRANILFGRHDTKLPSMHVLLPNAVGGVCW